WIYKKEVLDKDPHWYEKNFMGSGPFKFASLETGQAIKGVKNPDYYHEGLPYLDGFAGIYAEKQAIRVEAIRGDRAAIAWGAGFFVSGSAVIFPEAIFCDCGGDQL